MCFALLNTLLLTPFRCYILHALLSLCLLQLLFSVHTCCSENQTMTVVRSWRISTGCKGLIQILDWDTSVICCLVVDISRLVMFCWFVYANDHFKGMNCQSVCMLLHCLVRVNSDLYPRTLSVHAKRQHTDPCSVFCLSLGSPFPHLPGYWSAQGRLPNGGKTFLF